MERDQIKPKYILITSMNFPSGGAGATYLNLFCRGLKLEDRSISVILLKGHAFGSFKYKGPRKNITAEGIPYTYLGFTMRPSKKLIKIFDEIMSLARLMIFLFSLLTKQPKHINLLIFNSELHYNVPILLFSKIFGIKTTKFVAEYIDRSEFGDSLFGRIKRIGYIYNFKHLNNKSDKLLVFSLYLKDYYMSQGYSENKILVQPNLTDFDYWKTGNNEIKYTLGYSGAPYLKDGLHDLFHALSIINKKNININLLVIGDATFGKSLIPDLKKECLSLGLSENVYFTGLVELSMVKHYLSECKILAITRPRTEQTSAGFPTKLGEYFATGKPVLATNFGDMEKYFADGVDLVMAECGNYDSIASKIKWMLENDKEIELVAQNGYKNAVALLEYRNSVKRMINFFEN